MSEEQLPENLGPNDLAEALLQKLKTGARLDPTLRHQLLESLADKPSTGPKADEGVTTAVAGTAEALKSVTGKVSLDSIQPRNENETIVLRAVRARKMLSKISTNHEWGKKETEEAEWFRREFDRERPEYRRAMIDLLKDFGATLDIDDVKYFFDVLNCGEQEYFRTSFSGITGVPKGFSEGDLLEIRRNFIQRYLDEIPENEDDPYNSPRLWYAYLIRPDVFCYERGEDVRYLVDGAIEGYGSQEGARPDRAAYVRGVLKAALDNLDGEKDVVAKLNELSKQYPGPEYAISFKRGKKGHGNIVVIRPKDSGERMDYSDVVKTLAPEKPLIASDFNVIR